MKFILIIFIFLFSNCKYYCDEITTKQTIPQHQKLSYSGKIWRNVTVPETYLYKTSKNNISIKSTHQYNIGDFVKIQQLGDLVKIIGKCGK